MTVDKFTPIPANQEEQVWHALGTEEVLKQLNTVADVGLSDEEAARRLEVFGPNQLTEKPGVPFWRMVWDQLNNFIVWLLIVAALLSGPVLGEWIDATAIMAIVVLNAILGVVQERNAAQALAALRKLAAPEAHVLRSGSRITIPASQLVPGDVVVFESGFFIPADVRLTDAVNLRVEEAALTGESVPVQKDAGMRLEADIPLGDRRNTCFMGTVVNYGRGRGVVVATGMHTQIGLIAEMLSSVDEEETPLQRRLEELGKTLGWAALIICGLVFVAGWFRGYETLDMFMIAVSLAIAAVPEGLPAVVTISLALGMREMIHRHALIRKLSSVETLGSTTVICSDKTGTLTQNEMTAVRLYAGGKTLEIGGSGYAPEGEFTIDGQPANLSDYPAALTTLWIAALNNDAGLEQSGEQAGKITYRMVGDPTEGALIVAAAKAGAASKRLSEAYPRVQEVPFDATRKRMITIHQLEDPRTEDISPFNSQDKRCWFAVTVKGAPDLVLDLCQKVQQLDNSIVPLDEATRQNILAANDRMSQKALRVLAMAYRVTPNEVDVNNVDDLETDLVFSGLIGMIDPARAEVPPALKTAAGAGIRTVMITGDYANTARAIAEQIGLLRPGRQVLTGPDLNALDDEALKREVMHTDVFARVSPEHKMRIVQALRANNEVVAMTGDGVNDAPSIKQADIGIAMGITGTDVAKESADMVLTDDNYASIVAAVEQGRVIYDNIRKFVFFLLSSNVAEIMIIFLAILAGLPTPLTAIQLLWLNLLTDGAPALALAKEAGDPGIMRRKPRPAGEPIINRSMAIGITIQTITQTTAVLSAFVVGLLWHIQDIIPAGTNPLVYLLQYDWVGKDVQVAETMAFATLSLCELLRAYTVRSERESIFTIGLFSNRYMQYAVGLSIALLLIVIFVEPLHQVFNTHAMTGLEWVVVVGLAFIPAISEEITKFFLRRQKA